MNRDDIRKLLGGYATGTLTPEEEQALFAAALEDQELFDALAREQSLRDLLRDPVVKAQALAALDRPKPGWLTRWWRPAAMAAAMATVGGLVIFNMQQKFRAVDTQLIATVREAPPPMPAPEPSATPAAAPAKKGSIAPASAAGEKSADSSLPREAQPERAKELDAVARDSAIAAAPQGVLGGVAGGGGGRGGRAAPAPLSLPPAAPAPTLAVAPPPPPARSEGKLVDKLEAAATVNQTVSVEAADVQLLKAKSAEDLGARELFLQNVNFANQFISKDNSQELQQQAQQSPQAQQQQGGFRQQQSAKKATSAMSQDLRATLAPNGPVGVRYTILPSTGTPSIRFEPNAAGHISVWARPPSGVWRIVQSSAAGLLMPVTVRLAGGEKEIAVWFSRDPGTRSPQEPPAATGSPRTEGPRTDDTANYAVNPNAAANEVRFNITLN